VKKKTCLLLLISLCFYATSFGQKDPMRFGKISTDDLKMESYANDPEADAVILGDFGTTTFEWSDREGFQSNFTRHLRIKVFKREAYKYGDFKIKLFGNKESGDKLIRVKASSYYLENGKVIENSLSKKDIFVEVIHPRLHSENFSVPGLREGCVFEVEYTVVSNFIFDLQGWQFQYDIPAIFSEYRTYIPEYFIYKQLAKGFLKLQTDKNSNTRTYTIGQTSGGGRIDNKTINYREDYSQYRIDNVVAFRSEPFMNDAINYYSQIEFELAAVNWPSGKVKDFSSDWDKVNKELLDASDFGDELKHGNVVKDQSELLNTQYSDPKERMLAAYELIRKTITWNNRNSIYVTSSLKKAIAEGKGNSAEVNMALVLLLRECGIQADPVILSTRKNGLVFPTQIMISKFNYVIARAKVGEETFLLDATQTDYPYFLLPEKCINGEGRIISETNAGWVQLDEPPVSETKELTQIMLKPNGNMDASITRQLTNHAAADLFNHIKSFVSQEEYLDKLESGKNGMSITKFTVKNDTNWSKPFEYYYLATIINNDEQAKEMITLDPLIFEKQESNPFRLEDRQFPVDFIYPRKSTQIIRIVLPEGYVVDQMPENIAVALPDNAGFFRYRTIHSGQQIQLSVEVFINKAFFPYAEYADLKAFYSMMVQKQAESIIIKKG